LLCGDPHKRKNWLFFGSDSGGQTAAICFTILAGAKRHRIEPFAYVRDVLKAVSSDDVDLEKRMGGGSRRFGGMG
jgi:hypothetical protein